MLGKLLKYDLRIGIKQYVVIAAVFIALLVSALFGLITGIDFINGLIFASSVIFTIVSIILFMFISPSRIYAQLAKDESYFNYMLPVGIHKLLFSKIISHVIWGIATICVIILFWKIYYHICPVDSLKEFVNEITSVFKGNKHIAYFLAVAAYYYLFVIVLMFIFSIALSNMPVVRDRNAGILTMVISFFVIYQGLGLIMAGIWIVIILIGGGNLSNEYLNSADNINFVFGSLTNVMLGIGIVSSILLFFGGAYILDKKRSI